MPLRQLWSSRVAASEVSSGPASASADEEAHLRSCAECRARYDAFAGWLDDARAEAIDEADEIFSAERLGCAADADPAPARNARTSGASHRLPTIPPQPEPPSAADRSDGSRRPPSPASSSGWAPASCWTSAGASSGASAGHLGSQPLPLGQSARGTLQPVAFSSEDLFLYDDSDAASTSPSVEALQALDALTPRVRDLDQAR